VVLRNFLAGRYPKPFVTRPESTLTLLRWLFLGLVLATAAAAMSRLWNILRIDDLSLIEALYLFLVTILFLWISASFWVAAIGAYARWYGLADETLRWPRRVDAIRGRTRSRAALLFPVRNEDTRRVIAGIRTVAESIRAVEYTDTFDIYILSDSTDPDCILAESEAWQTLQAEDGPNIYYRHREDNAGKKAGNIAEFCRNWGALYDYMVVLDADSLMTADGSQSTRRPYPSGTAAGWTRILVCANPTIFLQRLRADLCGRSVVVAGAWW
jgi:membrane glycosyltransferase